MKLLAALATLIFAHPAGALGVGDAVPADLSAKNQNDETVRFGSFKDKGQYVLVYFYPKDETPGCTKQACDLRDRYKDIKALNTVILGVSRQDAASHQKFIAKHKLPFDLLVDADGAVGKALGVGSIPLVGFSRRTSLLIGPDGKVAKRYDDVDAAKHVGIVLNDLKQLQAKPATL